MHVFVAFNSIKILLDKIASMVIESLLLENITSIDIKPSVLKDYENS